MFVSKLHNVPNVLQTEGAVQGGGRGGKTHHTLGGGEDTPYIIKKRTYSGLGIILIYELY